MPDPNLSQFMTVDDDTPDLSQFMGGITPDKPYPNNPAPPAGTLTDADKRWLAKQKPNALGRMAAAMRKVTREVIPTATGGAGAGMGAAIGSLGGPLDFLTVPAGALVGGLIGGNAGKNLQTDALNAAPKVASALKQTPAQIKADETNYPLTTTAAGFVPALAMGTGIQRAFTPKGNLAESLLTPEKSPTRTDDLNAVRAAADRQGVKLPTTLTSPTGYRLSRAIPKIVGGSAIETAEANAPQAVGAKLSDMAARYGVSTDPGDVGAKVQDSAARWAEKQRQTGADLLERADTLGKGIPLPPTQTLAYIDEQLAKLERTPDASRGEIRFLSGVKSDLSDPAGPPDLGTLRQLRSSWYKNQDPGGLLPSAKKKISGDLWHTLSDDIGAGLSAEAERGNKNATDTIGAFDAGNKVWSNRAETIKSTLGKIFGSSVDEDISDPLNSVFVASKPPEEATATLAKMAAGDRRSVQTLLGTLDESAKDSLRASTIATLGRDGAGGFNAQTFLKNMHEIPEVTRTALFGKEHAAALGDLETVVKNISKLPQRQGGFGALGLEMALGSMLGIHGGYGGAGEGIVAVAGANMAVANLLSRPDTLRWVARLANASDKGAKVVGPLIDRLATAAKTNTSLYPLYEAVTTATKAATDKPAPPAAKPAASSDWTDEELGIAPGSEPDPAPTSSQGSTSEHVTLDPTAYENKPVEDLIPAVIHQESRGDPNAVSPKGAIGQMQLMPETAKDLGVDPHDPAQNIEGGTRHLTTLIDRYHGNQVLGLMAYNWGSRHVDDWIKNGMRGGVPKETRDYVHAILGSGSGQQ